MRSFKLKSSTKDKRYPAEFLVVVDEGEGQSDVEGVGFARVGSTFTRLKSNHQIDPTNWILRLERSDEVGSEDVAQQTFELTIDTCKHDDVTEGTTTTNDVVRSILTN